MVLTHTKETLIKKAKKKNGLIEICGSLKRQGIDSFMHDKNYTVQKNKEGELAIMFWYDTQDGSTHGVRLLDA